MKRIAKIMTASLIALCVLIGQSGVLMAMETTPAPSKCTKCPCESEKPSCCVEQSDARETADHPVAPAPESRILQPVSFEPVEFGVLDSSVSNETTFPRFDLAIRASSRVPLFLRHRAILI